MHSTYILYLQAASLFSATFAGGLLTLPLSHISTQWMRRLLAFGGSYLFSTTLLHALPELFESHGTSPSRIGFCLVLGFYAQLFLDFVSHGIAHNHTIDVHASPSRTKSSGFFLLLSLCIHAFLEGIFMARGEGHHFHHAGSTLLLISILLHKIPAAFSLTTALMNQGKGKKIMLLSLLLFSLTTPLTWLLTTYLQQEQLGLLAYMIPLSAIATGSILHISATILFESDPEHNISTYKWGAIFVGCLLAMIVSLH